MITGATDGIGKALAFQFSSKDLNLVLLGRNPAKLEGTLTEIEEKYKQVEIRTIALDLAKCSGEEITQVMEKGIQGLDIGVLINNAGLAYPYARYVATFNRCLSQEYKHQGIEVQCQIPLFVATNMRRLKKASLLIPSAEMYSKAAIRCIGYENLCIPYWPHSVQWFVSILLPESMLNRYIYHFSWNAHARNDEGTDEK